MLQPVEPGPILVNLRSPDRPVSVEIIQGLCAGFGAEINVVGGASLGDVAAAVGPEIQSIKVLVPREIVRIWQTAKSSVLDTGLDIGAVDLYYMMVSSIAKCDISRSRSPHDSKA